jgi:hypothetical protein
MLRIQGEVLARLVVGVVGALLLLQANASDPPRSDRQEKEFLAKRQIQCAGAFNVFRTSLRPENPSYFELKKSFTFASEQHARAALQLLEDKERTKSEIEKAAIGFGKQVAAITERKGDVRALIDAMTEECPRALVQSVRYLERDAHAAKRKAR